MRKKPTFQELANVTLKENKLGPLQLPYVPFNSSSQALIELRETMEEVQAQQHRDEDIRAATIQEARAIGVDPQALESLAQKMTTSTSQTIQQLRAEQQNAQAAEQKTANCRWRFSHNY